MIHQMSEDILKLPLQNYTLTFDDGLFGQYHFFDRLAQFNTDMIFFISTGIVCSTSQSRDFPPSNVAHEKAFQGNYEDFMNVEQLIEISKHPLVSIGGHSHNHLRLTKLPDLVSKVKHIEADTSLMMNWFQDNLHTKPTKFCYPYNEDFQGIYKGLLKKHGVTEFYGNERIPVEKLLHDSSQLAVL